MKAKNRRFVRWSLLIIALISVSMQPAYAAFSDVPDGAFFADPVDWMADEGITTGTSPTTFEPDSLMTRGQFATFLWRFAGEPFGSSNPFSDVPSGQFYTDAVKWMVDTEITTGTTPTTFEPDSTVTRGQVATFLWRYMCEPAGTSNPFIDVPSGQFYTDAVKWMVDAEITTGTTPTTFEPLSDVTRGQFATFLWRLAGEPPTGSPGDNRVTLAPGCDGTPPPPPPGVGTLSVSSTFGFGTAGVNVGDEGSLTISHVGSTGAPSLTVTSIAANKSEFTADFTPFLLAPGDLMVVPIRFDPTELGLVSGTMTILHSGSNGPSTPVAVTGTGEPGSIHKINAGGDAVSGWTRDSLAEPSPLHNMVSGNNSVLSTATTITDAGGVPQAVLQTARRDFSSSVPMEWDLPLPASGYYLVRLHFAELSASFDQQNVKIDGSTALEDFDVGIEAGGTSVAIVRSFVVESSGVLDIDLGHTNILKDTYINAIEVLSLGTKPDGYVSVSPMRRDVGSIATTGGSLVETVTLTNLGSTTVSIASLGAAGDFSTDKSSLVIPVGGSAEFDLTFDPSADGIQTQWVELDTPLADDLGIHVRGHGGVGTTATARILQGRSNVDLSVFSAGSIIIRNDSATADITSISFDLTGALLAELSFDVVAGPVIDENEKDFTNDFSDVTVTTQSNADGDTYVVDFSGFGPGDSIFASVDVDPLSATGMTGADATRTGPTSGLELVGTEIVITYAGGATTTAVMWSDGSGAGSDAFFFTGAVPISPTISLASGSLHGDATVTASQTVDIVCTAGEDVALVQAEAELDTTGGSGPAPVGGNRILDWVTVATATCGGGGTVSIPITLQDTTPSDASDGWNQLMVLHGDPDTGPTATSSLFAVRLDS